MKQQFHTSIFMMSHLKQSTTLFPRRMNGTSGTDFFKSDYKGHENSALLTSECQNRKMQKSRKTLVQAKRKPTVDMPSIAKCKPSTSATTVSSPKGRSNINEIESLKCFLCNKVIKTDHLSEHLLFGEVKCSKCSTVFEDCQCFQLWTIEHNLGNTTCEHTLQYSKDPLQSLEMHLSNQYLENGTNYKASVIDKPAHIRAYTKGMRSLKHDLPWESAVLQFKRYSNGEKDGEDKKKLYGEIGKYENANQSNHKNNGVIRATDCNRNDSPIVCTQEPKNGIITQNTKDVEAEKLTSNDQVSRETDSFYDVSNHGITSILTNSSPIKIPNGDSNSPNKKRKAEVKKRRKTEWISGLTKKKGCNSKSKRPVDYVETPVNGFYYVVRHAVSECPNCYGQISPPDFTVNIVTFLMTAVCSDCGLTIYIVHDPPDDSTPRVCIVTGGDKNRKKNNQKTLPQVAIV